MKSTLIISLVAMIVVFLVGYDLGRNVSYKEKTRELTKHLSTLQTYQDQIAGLEYQLKETEKSHETERQTLLDKANKLATRVAAFDRLRVKPAPNVPPTTPTPTTGSSNDSTATLELSGSAGHDLVRLAYDADQVALSLKSCQNYVSGISDLNNVGIK